MKRKRTMDRGLEEIPEHNNMLLPEETLRRLAKAGATIVPLNDQNIDLDVSLK